LQTNFDLLQCVVQACCVDLLVALTIVLLIVGLLTNLFAGQVAHLFSALLDV